MNVCKRCLVSGRVQGVFYRASTARRASELGLNGYARNLADGRVEVLVCGSAESVAELCEWLWQGPPAAEVSEVVICEMECAEIPRGFSTR
ncbi:MAG: acylphosphatase [Gammaproteobacteria bacterium]|nr:acylphosphatase [Gammaproteobacteria bacterium]